MLSLVLAVLRSLAGALHTRRHLVLENLALRHQLLVLKRTAKTPALRNADRLFWAVLSTMWSRWTRALVIVQPQRVVRWHQAGFRLYWRWKSRSRTGRAPIDRELIELIRRMWRSPWDDLSCCRVDVLASAGKRVDVAKEKTPTAAACGK